jgi:hypothetical protein
LPQGFKGVVLIAANKGGLTEYIIDPKNVTVKRASGANPNF